MENDSQDSPLIHPADSEGIVKSPSGSIFSDDDDIWFEASDQLIAEEPTASPPLTPTEDKEKLAFIEPGPPLTPTDHYHRTEQLLGEDENDGAMDYQDIGMSADINSADSDMPVIVQDGGATEHAQNTDDLNEGAPDEIDTFQDMHPDREQDTCTTGTVKIEEDSAMNAFMVAQDLNPAPTNVRDIDSLILNRDADVSGSTQDTGSDALNIHLQGDTGEPTQTQDTATDIFADTPDQTIISAALESASRDISNAYLVNQDQKINLTSAIPDIDDALVSQDKAVSVDRHHSEVHLAESMVKELRKQQKMVEACRAEASYVEVCTAAMMKASVTTSSDGTGEEGISMESDGMGMGPEVVESPEDKDGIGSKLDELPPIHDVSAAHTDDETRPLTFKKQPEVEQHQQGDAKMSAGTLNSEAYLAESLVRELKMQQKMVESCKIQTRYVEMCTSNAALMTGKEPGATSRMSSEPEKLLTEETYFVGAEMEERGGEKIELDSPEATMTTVMDFEPTEHVQKKNVKQESNSDELHFFEISPHLETLPSALVVTPKAAVCNASTNTDPTHSCSQSTNTFTPEFSTQGVNTDPPPVSKEIGCNTVLNCFDVLQRAKEMEELQFLKVEHQIAVRQMNEAKSQKMVAEQLTKIVQSDLAELRQQNISETTRRLQLENELSDAKIELSQTTSELKEKEERVKELEESLSGTALLVRKLEEQSAVSLMSRGGIDYMLQAKLADGRAQEAEQKLEVVQSELLQAQSEVRRLLDRVAEASRDRSEMVSSRVHTQLMQIADERAQAAERKSLELEREIQELRGRLSMYETGGMGGGGGRLTGSSGLTGLTSFSGLSGLGGGSSYSSSLLGSTYSPFSYTSATMATKPLSLSEQYNIHSDLAPPTVSSSATPTPFTSSFLKGMSNGASSKSLGSGASYSNDDISGLNKATGVSGILKPSQMFKKHGDESHDQAVNGSHAHSGHVTSSEGADGGSIELPSFEAMPTKPHSPTKVKFSERLESGEPISVVTGGNRDDNDDRGDDSDSSDWSSSASDGEDGEGRGGEGERGGGSAMGEMKPSHHTNLIAEWEWRTMADSSDTSSAHPPSGSPLTKRRVPPPVAPKPHGMFKPSSMTGAAGVYERTVQFEAGSSFDVPTHSATIQGLRRPRGPRGRNLPSRYRGNNNWLLNVNN